MQDSFKDGMEAVSDLLWGRVEDASCSRYAEPDADGVKPVLRTGLRVDQELSCVELSKVTRTLLWHLQIFRISLGALVLLERCLALLADDQI